MCCVEQWCGEGGHGVWMGDQRWGTVTRRLISRQRRCRFSRRWFHHSIMLLKISFSPLCWIYRCRMIPPTSTGRATLVPVRSYKAESACGVDHLQSRSHEAVSPGVFASIRANVRALLEYLENQLNLSYFCLPRNLSLHDELLA